MNEPRDNAGSMNRNEDKTKPGASPTWPDYKGAIRVEGVDYWLSGWVKSGRNGKFLSLSVKAKDEAKHTAPAPAAPAADDAGFGF